jgi:hypothetical protein
MSITIQWDNQEKTILCLGFVQPWTWAELANIDKEVLHLAASVPHSISMIVNLSEAGLLPNDALGRIRTSMTTASQSAMPLRSVVVVGAGLLDQSIAVTAHKTLRSAHDMNLQFGATLDEARALLSTR